MKRPFSRPIRNSVREAQVNWRDGAPFSEEFGDVYFSGSGAGETDHVFLAGNNLAARFAAGGLFSIGELGFGAGLNFLKTWALWNETRRSGPSPSPEKGGGAHLRFLSVEAFPLALSDLQKAHAAWPDLAALSALLRAALPPAVRGFHQINIAPDVTLILAYGEAGDLLARAEGGIDAWFFDGFSPAKNPQMWRREIFADAARLSRRGATFATYTVAGEVRRALAAAGFAAEKREGFGRKREMLAGAIGNPPHASRRAPWFRNASLRALPPCARIAILGGGIAGASLAREAARAGLQPAIFDAEGLAAGASGNPAGLIMPRLDLGESAAAGFFVAAYLHVIRLLNELRGSSSPPDLFNPCGALLGAANGEERARQRKILDADLLPDGWIEARADGLFFPQAGVVDPRAFASALAAGAPLVRARVTRIVSDPLAIELDDGSLRAFDAVIIANGVEALAFEQTRSLPLSASLGQIDWFPHAPAPPHAIAFGPYAAPAPNRDGRGGGLVIGATYEKIAPREPPRVTSTATEENIAAVARFAPEIAARLDAKASRPRAAIRCQTPDRLPVAGPLPDLAFFGGAYDDLRAGAARDYPPGGMIPGVYILAGLGSRGLVTAPLAAAMIVAEMTGAPSPAPHEIAEALHPARFFIRDLKRAQTAAKR